MTAWYEAGNVRLSESLRCYWCPSKVAPRILPIGFRTLRGRREIHAARMCETCAAHEEARLEGEDKGWRLCQVDFNELCDCGRPYVLALHSCHRCWYEQRMLEKRMAEVRFLRRLVKQIRSEVRSE